jgi:hypothetical protein
MRTTRHAWSPWTAGLAVLAGFLLAAPAPAQDAVSQAPSLKWVPADAASYSVMLRNREQIEAVLHSKALARLLKMPIAQQARQFLETEWAKPNGQLAILRNWYEQEGNADLVRLLGELFEEEVFVYNGKHSAELFVLFQEMQVANQFAPLVELFKGRVAGPGVGNNPLDRMKALFQVLAANEQYLQVPDVVIGFRLSRTKPAHVAQRLRELEKTLETALPAMQPYLKKVKIHGADVHTLVLESRLFPWDLIPLQNFEEKPGDFDKLLKRLKELKLTIALGVRGNYVLVGLGAETAGLQDLGSKLPNRLSERTEMARLADAAGRKLNSISYVSKAFREALAGGHYMEGLAATAGSLLKESGLSAAQKMKIEKDLKDLTADARRLAPQPGAQLGYTFLTEQGQEGYAYDWSKTPGGDTEAKPLTLLQHVGGHPLGFAVGRGRAPAAVAEKEYKLMVHSIKMCYRTVEDLVLPQLDMDTKDRYHQFMKQAKPLFARLEKATGTMLLPGLEGQGGLVLDARMTGTQWHQAMPASDKPLPYPEIALVLGVRDAGLLRQAFHEYREIFNGLMEAVAKVAPNPIPEIRIPEPQTKKVKAATLYYWPLPEVLGLDPRLMPTGGLSDSVAVLTFSQEHAQRLLKPTAFKAKSGPLADTSRPLVGAGYFSWSGFVDKAAPWVAYGLTRANQGQDVQEQVQTVLEVLKCLRSYSSATYIDQDVTVTHSLTVIRDLEK